MMNALLKALVFVTTLSIFQHGTTIVALHCPDGFVVAADSLGIIQTLDGKPEHIIPAAESKLAVCGKDFICATAGANPIHWQEGNINIEYHFQNWIAAIKSENQCCVRNFANAVRDRARATFQDMDRLMRKEEFWKSDISQGGALTVYQIVGFDPGEIPVVCKVYVEFDKKHRKLSYPDPTCARADASNRVSLHIPSYTQFQNVLQSQTRGTPQAIRLTELIGQTGPIAKALIPNASSDLQTLLAAAVSLVRVESEFNPQRVGGAVTVGILARGQKASVAQFPDR